MSNMITVRDINAADKTWLKAEASRRGISMEELVRRIIREQHEASNIVEKPSDIARRYFGHDHGLDMKRTKLKIRPVEFEA